MVGGDRVGLTATEYRLVHVLALDAGRIVTYDELLRQVWSGQSNAPPTWCGSWC